MQVPPRTVNPSFWFRIYIVSLCVLSALRITEDRPTTQGCCMARKDSDPSLACIILCIWRQHYCFKVEHQAQILAFTMEAGLFIVYTGVGKMLD